jgi:hypothetical protein
MLKRGVGLDYLFCNLGGGAHRDGALGVMKLVAEPAANYLGCNESRPQGNVASSP